MNKDLTVGKPETVLWKFCIPLFGSVLFQQLYNIADSLVAGKFIGENALAAVGNSYELTLIYIAVAFGCNMGCSVIVSKYFGAKRIRELKTAVSTTFIASGVFCVILMAVGLIFCHPLLRLINTPKEIFADSALYLNIYVAGVAFLMFYNICTGIFSALGDSKTPFIFLAFSSTANVFVDILFVKSFHMGVAGVAWATFICQGVSCVLAVVAVFRRLATLEHVDKAEIFSVKVMGDIAVIAIPSILQQSFISIGNIIIQGIINGFGPGVIAGYAAAIKLNNLVITSFSTIGNGMSNFTAQNIGAGKTERIGKGYRGGLLFVYALCIPLVLLYLFAGRILIHFFLDDATKEAMNTGITFLRIVAPFYFVVATKLISDGVLRGAGAMKLFMTATFADLILRVVLAFIFAGPLGETGIWCAWPIGWVISTIMSFAFYKTGIWKPKVPISKPENPNEE